MNPFLSVYCERSGLAGLFAEPLNAVTNIAFLVAAVLVWRTLRADPTLSMRRHWDIAALAAVVSAIGLGSAAWHLYPIRPTLLADVIPITVFIHGFIAAFMVRVMGLKWWWALGVVAFFVAASYGAPSLLSMRGLGVSSAYVPALAALGITVAGLFILGNPRRRTMLVAFVLFAASLGLRSIDGAACASFPLGTHFIWHMMNAAVLYTLLRVLIEAAREGAAAE